MAKSAPAALNGAYYCYFCPSFGVATFTPACSFSILPQLIYTTHMTNRDTLLGVIGTIYRWRKALRNVCLIALLGSIGIALSMDNYYESTTIFYPANQDLSKPEMIFGAMTKVTEYFGTDRDVDRLLEIASSNELADYMIDRYKL
ncbi:MAG: hypothetical protein IT261_07540, partial [Saprospiraceae bacterium]|nr:hypothetical protein [Saprospiraceae bacterium]